MSYGQLLESLYVYKVPAVPEHARGSQGVVCAKKVRVLALICRCFELALMALMSFD